MKTILSSLLLLFFVYDIHAQNKCNAKNWSTITVNELRNDGNPEFPYLKDENFQFSYTGNFLFIAWGNPNYGGGVMVYDVQAKKVMKNFKIEASSKNNYTTYLAVNPQNENEIAIQFAPKEIIVLPNWQEEPEYVLTERKKAFKTNRSIIKTKTTVWNMHYAKDGSMLYVPNTSGVGYKAYDKTSGEIKKAKEFSTKEYEFLNFSENDLVILFKTQGKKDKGVKKDADIFDAGTETVLRTATFPEMPFEFGLGGNNRYFGKGKVVYDITMDKPVETAQKLYKSIFDETHEIAYVYALPNLDQSNFVFNSSTKKGYFSSCQNSLVMYDIEGFQVSPDGKYFVYSNTASKQLILCKLY